MNLGISKKVIFFSFLFFNFLHSTKAVYLNKKTPIYTGSVQPQEFFPKISNKKLLKKNDELLLASISGNQKGLEIQYDVQSEINNVIYAEGNVEVQYEGKILKADNLIYDKLNKKISAQGNIVLIIGDQIFKVSQLEYSFIDEKGYLLNVKGSIKTSTLMNDLSSNLSLSDFNKLKHLIEFRKKEVL